MRTTIKLDDDVFRAYKRRAAEHGTTFAYEVEEALRAGLHARSAEAAPEPYEVPVFQGERGALIDIDDPQALEELQLEEEGWLKPDGPA